VIVIIYEFECQAKKCGAISEVIQSLSEAPITKCPVCKKGKVVKIMSLPARPVISESPEVTMQKAKAEGKQMAREILRGNQEVIAQVYGDDTASGKPRTDLAKPKQFKDVQKVKDNKIKRSKPSL